MIHFTLRTGLALELRITDNVSIYEIIVTPNSLGLGSTVHFCEQLQYESEMKLAQLSQHQFNILGTKVPIKTNWFAAHDTG